MFINYTSGIGKVYKRLSYQNLTNKISRDRFNIIDCYKIDQNPLFAHISYSKITILIGIEKAIIFIIFLNYLVSFDLIILYFIIKIAFFEKARFPYNYNIYIYKAALIIKQVDRNLVNRNGYKLFSILLRVIGASLSNILVKIYSVFYSKPIKEYIGIQLEYIQFLN